MNNLTCLELMLDAARLLEAQGLTADPWQRDLLLTADRHILLTPASSRGCGAGQPPLRCASRRHPTIPGCITATTCSGNDRRNRPGAFIQ